MFKPMTLSLSLVLALSATSVSMAGGPWGHGVTASAQGSAPIVTASPQIGCDDGCAAPSCAPSCLPTCAPKKFCFTLPKLPKIQCPKFRLEKYTVTKTKYRLVKCWPAPSCGSCGTCDSCVSAPAPSWPTSYPVSQPSVWGSAQGSVSYPSAPVYSAPVTAAPQYSAAPSHQYAAPAPISSGQAVISTPHAAPSMPAAPVHSAPAPPEMPKADGEAKASGALILDPVHQSR